LISARPRGCFVYESLELWKRPALYGSPERNFSGCAVCENIEGRLVEKAPLPQREALMSAWILERWVLSCQGHGLLRLRAIADAGCERPRAPQRLVRPTRRRRRKDCSQRPSSPLGRNADGPPQMKWRQAGKFMERLGNSASADWLVALRLMVRFAIFLSRVATIFRTWQRADGRERYGAAQGFRLPNFNTPCAAGLTTSSAIKIVNP